MTLLLDTHVLLWWWNGDPRLRAETRALIEDRDEDVVVSAVSAWEIATKARIQKLPELALPISEVLPTIRAQNFKMLAITPDHAVRSGSYEIAHADPFDRLLAAQSELDGIPLVTRDPAFAAFPCETRW